MNESIAESSMQETDSELSIKSVSSPRKSWMEFLLFFATFSLYSSVWSVLRAKDLKNANTGEFKPWLWLFAPLIWIAGMIAYRKVFDSIEQVESDSVAQKWKIWGSVWILVFVAVSLTFGLDRVMAVPMWVQILLILVNCCLFTLLHRRFNQWKLHATDLEFTGHSNRYTWYEWLLLIIGIPFVLMATYYGFKPVLYGLSSDRFMDRYLHKNSDLGYAFTIHGEDWFQVANGTVTESSDESLFEMIGPGDDTYVVIYEYQNLSFDSAISSRFDLVQETYISPECTERQMFTKNKVGRHSLIRCLDSDWSGEYSISSAFIEIDGRVFELVGEAYSTNKKAHKKVTSEIVEMARSFQPFNTEDQ